ncbi:MAG: oligoendopeptidase F, partial [Anaerolineales bacterium]
MTETTIPARSAIAPEHTWNAPNVFESDAAWEAEFKQVAESLPEVGAFQGKLGESAAALAEALEARDALLNQINKAAMYAAMAHLVDTTNQVEAGRYSQA